MRFIEVMVMDSRSPHNFIAVLIPLFVSLTDIGSTSCFKFGVLQIKEQHLISTENKFSHEEEKRQVF